MSVIKTPQNTESKYAVIGAGPAGISGAKAFKELGIEFDGFELGSDVGGLWNIENPRSTIYETAHLISSKGKTEYSDFPMPQGTPDFPNHKQVCEYFKSYARHFKLYENYFFNTRVISVEPNGDNWDITIQPPNGSQATYTYRGVVVANGTLSEPNMPEWEGTFDGEIMHSSEYKTPKVFEGKRVLIVGAGNSGCDIAVDAAHRGEKVDLSVRRGYYFVPKYAFGKPADTIGGKLKMPRVVKQWLDNKLLQMVTGDPVSFGFPKPKYKMYESHPVVNSLILLHIGQGDISVRKDIERFEGKTVHFKDGSKDDYDLIMAATGYKLYYPFLDRKHLNWDGMAPDLYLNMFHPKYDNLFILGMIEATGLGWEGRYEQARLMARYVDGLDKKRPSALKFQQKKKGPSPDMSGGYKYLKLARMAYYVHKETYRGRVNKEAKALAK